MGLRKKLGTPGGCEARPYAWLWALLLAACPAAVDTGQEPLVWSYPLDDTLRVNHLQVKGTHNSYHQQPEHDVIDEWNYTHAPLDRQLGCQGVRQFELDMYWEEDGTFAVLHVPGLDPVSSCETFRDCLATMRAWSDANLAHHPIFVQLELKDASESSDVERYLEELEAAIAETWPDRVLTPDVVQGEHADLPTALAADGWPVLGEVRGHVLFWLLAYGSYRDVYTHGGTGLDGRLAFVKSDPGDPWLATLNRDDPQGSFDDIQALVAAGYLVRTRADAGGVTDENAAWERLEAALDSGAHSITTDFPAPVEDHGYVVEIPGGTPSRCNPISAPEDCYPEALEDPAFIDISGCEATE